MVGLGMDVVRNGVLMLRLMGSSYNSLRSNLIRVTARIRVAIDYLTLDYGGSIRPWIV